jgi:hypothetical protein
VVGALLQQAAMTGRTAARLAWSLWALSFALAAGGVLVGAYGGVYSRSAQIPAVLEDLHSSVGSDLVFALWILVFTTMGALVAARRWRNPVGWLLLAEGLVWDLQLFAQGYAAAALFTHRGTLPAGELVLWVIGWWLYVAANFLVFFLVLLLPTGRLRSRRWRWAAWLGACCIVLVVPSLLARRALYPDLPAITNPVGLLPPSPLVDLLDHLAEDVLLPLLGAAAVTSLVLRFRTARSVERQQLKWLAYAAMLLLAGGLGGVYLAQWLGASGYVVSFFQVAPLGAIPVAVAVAVLRYRLYDIDRIINRTLVYGLLTATLGLGYAGGVLGLGQLFGGVSQQPPSWAIAATTLAMAALFQPLRRRIQNGVDRRFNRRRYDAAKTIEAFSARLRQEIDLDTLSAELLAVVDQTMEPTRASLWLRPSAQPPKSQAARAQ